MHFENKSLEIIALADGASSCKNSRKGAQIACETAGELLLRYGLQLFETNKDNVADIVLHAVLEALSEQQRVDRCELTDYSSTLCFVCLDKKTRRALCFSLGDSLIYSLDKNGCVLINLDNVNWSGKCCATTTIRAQKKVSLYIVDVNDMNGMMLCSDGAWKLFYHDYIFDSDLSLCAKKQKYTIFKKYIDESCNDDDSTFIIMDLLQNTAA